MWKKKVQIACAICQKPMIHDLGKMTCHMKKYHGDLSLMEYFAVHVRSGEESNIDQSTNCTSKSNVQSCPDNDENAVPKSVTTETLAKEEFLKSTSHAPVPLHDLQIVQREYLVQSEVPNQEKVQNENGEGVVNYCNEEKRIPSQPWYDQCTFQCKLCHRESHSPRVIYTHIRNEHHCEDPQRDLIQMVTENYFDCNVCGGSMTCDMKTVSTHLRRLHKMTIADYGKQHLGGSYQTKSKYVDMQKGQLPCQDIVSHAKNVLQIGSATDTSDVIDTVENVKSSNDNDTCDATNVSESNEIDNRSTIGAIVEFDHQDRSYLISANEDKNIPNQPWYDQCTFKCKLCHRVSHNIDSLQYHMRVQHKCKDYSDLIQRTNTNYLECKVCGEQIICAENIVSGHVKKHGKSLADYGKKYFFVKTANPDKNRIDKLAEKLQPEVSNVTDSIDNMDVSEVSTAKVKDEVTKTNSASNDEIMVDSKSETNFDNHKLLSWMSNLNQCQFLCTTYPETFKTPAIAMLHIFTEQKKKIQKC